MSVRPAWLSRIASKSRSRSLRRNKYTSTIEATTIGCCALPAPSFGTGSSAGLDRSAWRPTPRRAVEFRRELPRTETGKLQRFRLRQEE